MNDGFFWGFSVPTVAGKMICFINPLTKLSSPPFWEEYFEIHPLHPSPECSFSISLGRCKCYYDFELYLMDYYQCQGRIIGQ